MYTETNIDNNDTADIQVSAFAKEAALDKPSNLMLRHMFYHLLETVHPYSFEDEYPFSFEEPRYPADVSVPTVPQLMEAAWADSFIGQHYLPEWEEMERLRDDLNQVIRNHDNPVFQDAYDCLTKGVEDLEESICERLPFVLHTFSPEYIKEQARLHEEWVIQMTLEHQQECWQEAISS